MLSKTHLGILGFPAKRARFSTYPSPAKKGPPLIKLSYIGQPAEPTPGPAVTPALTAAIHRVEPVKQGEPFDSWPVVKQAEPFDNLASVKHSEKVAGRSRRKAGSVRSTPELLRAYNRQYQRKRRAAAKLDGAKLADADAAA